MKKKILLFGIIALLGGLSYLGYQGIKKQRKNKLLESTIQRLPSFSFYDLNQGVFTYKNELLTPTLIIYFHPDCEHCQYETKQLVLHKEKFKNVQILMISSTSLKNIQQFKKEYQLKEISNIKVLWDKDQKFDSYFGRSTYPTLLIYDAQNNLKKKFKGEVKITAILQHL